MSQVRHVTRSGEKINGVSVGKLEGKRHFKGLGLDVRLILKKILRKKYK
jgi:hypothetical protein